MRVKVKTLEQLKLLGYSLVNHTGEDLLHSPKFGNPIPAKCVGRSFDCNRYGCHAVVLINGFTSFVLNEDCFSEIKQGENNGN